MVKIKVPFTEQQIVLLKQLLDEKRYGSSMEELTRNLLREYARQTLGREYQES
jgi:hypothetical protein